MLLISIYNRLIDFFSFSAELHKLRRELNSKIDMPDSIEVSPRSHPLGVSKLFKRRRISIAESYLLVIRDLNSRHVKARLRALKLLYEHMFHAKTVEMPLNTARVQIALMKEAIRNRGNKRKQLELLHDFSVSSYGQPTVIRRFCDELNIIEVPETGSKLKDLAMGWDPHVHDSSTMGRKTSTQLLIDAFIKGMSELTIAYNHMDSFEIMEEAIEAGNILGIRVRIGLEFSVWQGSNRFHFMALLPDLSSTDEFRRYLKENRPLFHGFLKGLGDNQEKRIEAVKKLLENFNKVFLKELNQGFPHKDLYRVPKLKLKHFVDSSTLSTVNRFQLGEFLYLEYKPILLNRVLFYKAQREKALNDFRKRKISEWDFKIIDAKYHQLRNEYRDANPESLRQRFFQNPRIGDYSTVFDDFEGLAAQIVSAGCRIKILHPLEYGLEKAKKIIEKCGRYLHFVEVYNLRDNVQRDPDEILRFCRHLNDLNRLRKAEGKRFLIPVCGSDSTGRSPTIPGMGFVAASKVLGRNRKKYLKRHITLPPLVSKMILAEGEPVEETNRPDDPVIVSMGKITEPVPNRVGDEPVMESIPIRRVIRYLNPSLVNVILVAIGFSVAFRFIGLKYACVWFGITGIRNMVADIVSRRGARLREWNFQSVSTYNLCRSLFWTGFSVPILNFVKSQFDLLWPFAQVGLFYNFIKFFFISFANGCYLATHNTIRGFDKNVIRANFFRSVLSWPFASIFAPVGYLLGVPSIVQAKFWSDVVAGIIEGTGKYFRILNLRRRDLREILPRVIHGGSTERNTAILDLLYLFQAEPRSRNSLRQLLGLKESPTSRAASKNRVMKEYSDLTAVMLEDRVYPKLIDFVLEQYPPEVSVELVGLVSEQFCSFRDWLVEQGNRTGWLRSFFLQQRQAAPQGDVPLGPNRTEDGAPNAVSSSK